MNIVLGLILIVLGVLAASSVLGSLNDAVGEFIEETLRPVQGWIGLVGCIAGIGFLAKIVLSAVTMKTAAFMTMIAGFLGPALLTATGFLMGYSKIVGLIGGDAEEKALEVYRTLAPYQVALGFASIAVGAWTLLL